MAGHGHIEPDPKSLGTARPEVHETATSVIVLLGDRAYKLKKPVALPYLDWRTREAREAACRQEVALNRRLAPDVYLGVAAVVGPDGQACDHLVVMRRMPAERSLARLVAAGADLGAALDEIASSLAAFHARARRSPAISAAAGRAGVRQNWEDNLAALRDLGASFLDVVAIDRVDELSHRYLAGRARLFAERNSAGLSVDGHGDLLAGDVYLLDDGPRLLDCLDFDDRLRAVDVLDDAAFLAMDLERMGAPDLAERFLAAYRQHSGTHFPRSLAHHYIAYRAGVRAKVACIRADQGAREAAEEEAAALLDLARRHLEAGAIRLLLVGGLPGTGKSTLARRLAARSGAALVCSDVVRKEIAGLDPSAAMPAAYAEGIYAPDWTAATYRELLARGQGLLERGESVILDASFTAPEHRAQAAATAAATSADLVVLRCDAPPEMAAARIARRAPGPSDATAAIAARMAAGRQPWNGAVAIDTSGDPGAAERAAAAVLGIEEGAPG
jgi:hypothetical protein